MSQPFSIAIHGGAGTILREQMSDELKMGITEALEKSVLAGYQVLKAGGDALDAVVASVKVMEDSSHFNAGKGSVLTHDEFVEMDASVMHGSEMDAGAIAGVRHIKNPIELARDVMLKSDHVLLIGEGAEKFAFEHDYTFTEQDYFFTERRYDQLQSMKEKGIFALSEAKYDEQQAEKYPDDKKYGTVGAVALDQSGNLAAATSTGGVTNKKYGRVGDSPIIGAGTIAENGNVAVSTTSPISLAATFGISVDFFSSGYLDVSVPPVRLAALCIHAAHHMHERVVADVGAAGPLQHAVNLRGRHGGARKSHRAGRRGGFACSPLEISRSVHVL